MKSVLNHLLTIYHLPRLLKGLQIKVGHFIALTINATSQKANLSTNVNDSVISNTQNSAMGGDKASLPSKLANQRTFMLLNESAAD